MRRATFLKRTGLFIGGVLVAPRIPLEMAAPEAAPVAEAAGFNYYQLVSSGGLCAPMKPIYDLPALRVPGRPIRDALPSFTASRGGLDTLT